MTDILRTLDNLRRPKLLIRAARLGTQDYRRDVHLRRILGFGALPKSETALKDLLAKETELNNLRVTQGPGYSPMDHVDLLIAMMGEARIFRATCTPFIPTATAS